MPDRQHHRGCHPQDRSLFLEPRRLLRLRQAAGDLAWLLERRYAPEAALKLVGDHYQLWKRQRAALQRAVASPTAARRRSHKRIDAGRLAGRALWIDTFNQLITVEAALAGGVLLRGHDGALRDLASVHGRYRTVAETELALERIGVVLEQIGIKQARFWIDRPVSNSGKLAAAIRQLAERRGWPWTAELVPSADAILKRCAEVVATSDSSILDAAATWFDLAAATVERSISEAQILDLGAEAGGRHQDSGGAPLIAYLASRLPDLPRWVEARGMLLSGRCTVLGADGADRGFVICGKDAPLVCVVGQPALELVREAVERAGPEVEVVVQIESLALVRRALPDWKAEGATIHTLAGSSGRAAPAGEDIRPITAIEPDQLAALPAELAEEIGRALRHSVVVAAYVDAAPVSFCCVGWETETLWDVSIDTLEPYRRCGLARRCAQHMIERMLAGGKRPVWGSLDSNPASLALAAQLGFMPVDRLYVFTAPPTA